VTYLIIKRLIDIILSILGIFLFAPIMIALAITIKITSSGPILYKSQRTGKGNIIFNMYKFRSMVIDADKKGGMSTALNDKRLTKIGRFIRKYKLDELPQFFNVIFGQMSLVGPRPQIPFYTDRYVDEELLILKIRPGITDLASLYFLDMDSALGSKDVDKKYLENIEPIKNQLRIRYVKEMNFLLDLRIMLETLCKLIGVNNITRLNIHPPQISKANDKFR